VTARPAGIELGPLRFLPGDVRGLPEAETLRLRSSEPFAARLLERARAAAKSRRPGHPLVVADPSANAALRERELEAEMERRAGAGEIEHSPWAGRIISVR
jgi:hypothetical protein